jgi:competence protein ComEC
MASAFGAGIALYFALPREPAVTTVPIVLLPAIAAVFLTRRRPAMLVSAGLILVFAMGFSLAQIRARVVEAPVLRAELERVVVEGEVMEIELQPTGQRVTLTRLKIGDLAPALTPSRIRLRVVVDQPELSAGQRVAGLADLSPPQGPAAPGSYDFRRDAYFQRLGAIGFSYGRMRILSPRLEQSGPGRLWDGVMHGISDLRRAIALRIVEQLPERPGALAVALVVGDQRAIAKADVEAMRDSGLAHILSISGLHIGLAAGLVFFSVRAVLALIPPLALAQPIKKWAAGAAILSAFFYAILAGWTTPTQRAFIMGGLVFAAIMIDRSPISLRLVAVAAMLTLVMRPEALMGASFQMSFAAVFMLIVAFEGLGPWLSEKRKAIATGEIMPPFRGGSASPVCGCSPQC